MTARRADPLTPRLAPFGTTIFTEVTALADRHGAVNLGQGFPDFDGPEFVKEAARDAIVAGHNQYSRMAGLPDLVRAVAAHRRRFYDLTYDAMEEVTIFSGSTEALAATLQALFDPGDEVILFEPVYDSYRPCLAMAGATPRLVPLRPPGFALDVEMLERAVTPATRGLVLNSPQNPSGKVFSEDELAAIATVCIRHDLIAVTDEVYEHLVFTGRHVPLATLPGMRERTVMISSAGKTFSLTGWKIGFACAPAPLTRAVRAAHQFLTFCVATPMQHAIAVALSSGDEYYRTLHAEYAARRAALCAGLAAAGFGVEPPAGTYFALADIRPLGAHDDAAFCRELPARVGVAAIPVSAFVFEEPPLTHLVRFAFCKSDAVLVEGVKRLRTLRA